jgi:fluoroquinolone transport system permease protein
MINIIKTDIKNLLRDPSLLMICLVPLLILALLHRGYPVLIQLLPVVDEYRSVILAMFCIVVALMPGTAMAFAMLDEKDNNLQQVLQILPVSFRHITLYRTGLIFVFGFISSLMILQLSGMSHHNMFTHILQSLLAAATAPIMVLIPAFFAANKIEGATFSKGLNFLIMLPIPAFIFHGTWNWFLAILPSWWIYLIFGSQPGTLSFFASFLGGILWHLAILLFLFHRIFVRIEKTNF